MNTTYSTDPTVRAALARLPAAGPIADRAADLVSAHERCVGQALGELPPASPTERVELVELYRLALLTELDELAGTAGRTPAAEGAALNPVHWSQVVPVAVLDRFGELWAEARQLGKRPRSLLNGGERARLDQVEAELDDLVGRIVAAMPVEGMPGLVAGAVEAVRDTRDLQRYYRRTLCPTIRRELPGVELATDALVESVADVVGIFQPAAGEGGAP